MKKLLLLLSISIVLTSCGAAVEAQTGAYQLPETSGESINGQTNEIIVETPVSEASNEELTEEDDDPIEEISLIYTPEEDMTSEQIVTAYFEQQYLAYINFVNIDLESIVNMDKRVNRNMIRWFNMLILRRKLLRESDLCYVETQKFPYTITFDEVPEDDRMERWEKWLADSGESVVHFRIIGDEGKAYPPIMAMNSQHSMFFKEVDGTLKIMMHYFPGSARKFSNAGTIKVPKEDAMLMQLEKEFGDFPLPTGPEPPKDASAYDAAKAVEYAMRYTEKPNPAFYNIGDWIGNCANFVSQCLWSGFGGEIERGEWSLNRMTADWCGGDGGSPAWENVNHFWSYIMSGRELGGEEFDGVARLRDGDIIQTRSLTVTEEDRFTHMLIVVDEDTLMLAQNSPSCFVYYSDIVNVETRFIRPTYMAE